MSENRKSGLRRSARIAGLGAAAAVGLGLMSTGAAHADTFVPLPGGERVVNAGDVSVKIARNAESALISPSLAANGAGRVAWVTGDVFADVQGDFEEATLKTGYIVGCQVDITGLEAGLSGGLSLSGADLSGSLSLPIKPGEVKFASIKSKKLKEPGVAAIQYKDAEIQVQGCGGYAQARAYTVVEVPGNHYVKGTLYGQPFSIG
ncbi:mspA family protein [Rhodococcus triatomae]|uniref:MspA protein n=1 Tax=Rhodococcus triatomae TaxID=300028 RepID=A0A1G8AA84_9NOCA|nr:MspA family porin [Rhodococcus triatomae]QNG17818.1 mspA family protein [Rhodococcus triatomae]QNG17820.1 mspA family protein [Rhodococcus triatomae]QNG22512.1 mspA family protein [Rhodococcus triatomae]QNG22514.1 mspA family protein [Rhodococcus triatomae]SDH17874.1 MspA protein [Rhodococcus triatomae]